MLAKERGEMLRDVFLLHRDNEQELAQVLALESGKPLAEAIGEIKYGAGYFEWFAEEAKRAYGDIIPEPLGGRKLLSFKEPVGVCGLITPWNFPNAMIARKVAPALAAGCTTVIKPAQDTPLSTLALCKIFEKVGIPPGVVNVVTSGFDKTPQVGNQITADPRVRKVSFTGSTRVGQLLMKQSSESVKKLSMELGGDAPFIIFSDADLDKAVAGLMLAKFRNAGQTCVASNRVFVHSSIYERFSEMIADKVSAMKVGRFDEPDVTIGPLINQAGCAKVDSIVQTDVANGAKVLVGGQRLTEKGACWYAPTVLADCNDSMQVAKEETFGPVIPLFKFETDEEVLARANNTDAGLAAYFFTQSLPRIFHFSKNLQYGMIGCNTGVISSEVVPFGGIKYSGLGREGSKYGLDDYMHIKTLTLQHD